MHIVKYAIMAMFLGKYPILYSKQLAWLSINAYLNKIKLSGIAY